jgi:transmembrane sensor
MTRAHDGFDGRAEEIEQKAAEWVTRIDLHGTPEEWAALDAWLAASPRHRAAFLRLSVAWRRADELKKLAPLSDTVDEDLLAPSRWKEELLDHEAVRQGRVIPLKAHLPASHASTARADESEPTRGVFRSLAASRLAASVAIMAVLAGAGAWYGVERSRVDVYSTDVGEFHRISLQDGSTIALNTDSQVRVRYSVMGREVELARGEALFEVAKDTSRPFDVKASNTTVRAVGTAFSVRLQEEGRADRVDVLVSEGRVAINPPSQQTLPAGSVATVRNGRVQTTTLSSDDISSRLMWTTGRLVFQGQKLDEVVAEINRYNKRKLLVTDTDISGLRIGGTFQATDPEGFARALDRTFGIKSHRVSRFFGNDVIRLDSGVP